MIVYTSYGAPVYHRKRGNIPGCVPVSQDVHMFDPRNSPFRSKALGWNTLIHEELTKLMGDYPQSTHRLIKELLIQFPKP